MGAVDTGCVRQQSQITPRASQNTDISISPDYFLRAALETGRHSRRAGRRASDTAPQQAIFFPPADIINCRIRTGHPQDAPSLADDIGTTCSECYTHAECTELAS